MRKPLLFLSLAAAGTVAAQTTITSADQPYVSQVYHQTLDSMGGQNEGVSGPAATYSFSGLLNQQEDSMTFTAPQWTPYVASYPSSNICIMQNTGDSYIYATMSSSMLEVNGQASDPFGNGVIPLIFANPETQMIYPAAYGSSFADTAGGINQFYLGYDPGIGFPIDSVRIHTIVTKNSDFDGWGSLTSPLGTFNVLRQNTFRKQIDTIDIYAFGMWNYQAFDQMDSVRTYSYWANGIGMPLVDLTAQDDLGMITSATWLLANPTTTGIPVNENNNTVIAYPNPTADVLTIETTAAEGNIELVDMTGRVVATAVINTNVTRIDVTNLSAGMYMYRVNGVAEGKVQVAH